MLSLPLTRVLIDIPTHSLSYYATRFLWAVSDFCIYGIAWGAAWFRAATLGGVGVGVQRQVAEGVAIAAAEPAHSVRLLLFRMTT